MAAPQAPTLTAEFVNAAEVVGLTVLLAMLMSAGRAGRAGAAPSVLLVLLLDVGVLDEPVKAATPDAEDEAEAAAPAPARSHGLGGAALLAVDILLRECSCCANQPGRKRRWPRSG